MRGKLARARSLLLLGIKIVGALCVAMIITAGYLVYDQDSQILPALTLTARNQPPPNGVTRLKIPSTDNVMLDAWYVPVGTTTARFPKVALLFQGSGGQLHDSFPMQASFRDLGISSLSFDYRGVGHSSGYPSERSYYDDARAVWKYLVTSLGVAPDQIIVVGSSLGTGFAAFVGKEFQPTMIALLAPYTSIPDVVAYKPFLRFLRPLLRYEIPQARFLKDYRGCSALFHGTNDNVIPYVLSQKLDTQLRGVARHHLYTFDGVGHEISRQFFETLQGALTDCGLGSQSPDREIVNHCAAQYLKCLIGLFRRLQRSTPREEVIDCRC